MNIKEFAIENLGITSEIWDEELAEKKRLAGTKDVPDDTETIEEM